MWFLYDVGMVVIVVIAVIRGALRGLIWQLAVIGSLLLSFLAAKYFSPLLSPHIPLDKPVDRWVAMLVIYLVVSFFCFALARGLRKWIEKIRFVEYDRHLGAWLGLVKGVLFALVLTFFCVAISASARERILRSYSGYAAAMIIDQLCPFVPPEWHDILEPYIHSLDDAQLPEHAFTEIPPDASSADSQLHAADDHLPPDAADADSANDEPPTSQANREDSPALR